MKIYDNDGNLKQDVIDVLYELGNMGVATAVMPIGNLREIKIKVAIPNVITVKDNATDEIAYDPEQIVVCVMTKLDKTLSGSILFLFSKEFLRNTIYEMIGLQFSDDELLEDEDCLSAIAEVVNYMTAGYAKVIGAYLHVPVYICAISIGMEKVRTIVEGILAPANGRPQKMACVDTKFTIVNERGVNTNETGQVLIFPDDACIQRFMEIMED